MFVSGKPDGNELLIELDFLLMLRYHLWFLKLDSYPTLQGGESCPDLNYS